MKLTFALIFQTATAHMAMTLPAPRRSPQHPAYRGSGADYDITAPLGGRAKFPCRGAPAGPIFRSYQAGSDIDVRIGGSAVHGGGHCQFSMTYDSVNFAVLKTVMGNCLTASRDYKVSIPKDAPNGNVTFAWTWFNKVGNREIYMNCADITITGGSNSGTITGKKMVVANWPGYPTFPEKFANDYGKALYENQPLITIRNTKSIVPKAAPLAKKVPFISKPLAKNISSKRCIQGKWYCKGLNKIGLCQNNAISYQNCYRGTICQSNGQASYCQKSS